MERPSLTSNFPKENRVKQYEIQPNTFSDEKFYQLHIFRSKTYLQCSRENRFSRPRMFPGHVISEQVATKHVHSGTERAFVHDVASTDFPRKVLWHRLNDTLQRQLHPLLRDGRGRQCLAFGRTIRLTVWGLTTRFGTRLFHLRKLFFIDNR